MSTADVVAVNSIATVKGAVATIAIELEECGMALIVKCEAQIQAGISIRVLPNRSPLGLTQTSMRTVHARFPSCPPVSLRIVLMASVGYTAALAMSVVTLTLPARALFVKKS